MKKSLALVAALAAAPHLSQPASAQSVNVLERDGLKMHVFVSKPVIFEVASVVLEGAREVALIDAQFSADNAQRVVELIKATGKPLTTIFISYSDPDYYFGLDHIARQFPQAKIYATPQTVYLINATKDEKAAFWLPQLGANAPQKVVAPMALLEDHFMLENRRIEIKKLVGDEQHSFLWIPSVRAVLGGIYLNSAQHLWVADSPTREDRDKWQAGLDAIAQLQPEYAIPAHFIPSKTSLKGSASITFTKQYLTALEGALAESKNSTELVQAMKKRYPNLGSESNLEMTAKVLKGEMPWKTTAALPAIGRKVEVNFGGDYVFELDFKDEQHMTYVGIAGKLKGSTDNVKYTAIEVAPKVYMVYWTETAGPHVVHVEDYGSGVAYTNISNPNGTFFNLKGTLRLLSK